MAQILILNVDDAVIEALRQRAVACGTSVEEQGRRALTQGVVLDREAAAWRLADMRRIIGRLDGRSILEDVRHDRGRDDQ
jgi:plasmid stability protein